MQNSYNKTIKDSPEIARILQEILKAEAIEDRMKEHLWVIGLDSFNKIIYIDLCSLGILDKTLVHPREVFRVAITKSCNSIIVAHNHPSGDTKPSEGDIKSMQKIRGAGEILLIPVLDTLIITENDFFRF